MGNCSRYLWRKLSIGILFGCTLVFTLYTIFTNQQVLEEYKTVINLEAMIISFKQKHKPENIFQRDSDIQTCVHFNTWKAVEKPLSNFQLIVPYIEPYIPIQDRTVEMIVVVNSACGGQKHQFLRTAIRKTWANLTALGNDKMFRVFYSLGLCNAKDDEENEKEALENNDIIIGNFTDNYSNVKYKTFMALQWAFCKFSSSFIVKTDDDIYLLAPRLLYWLHKQNNTDHFYGGFLYTSATVFRDPNSPWFVSRDQFGEDIWPPFALGACTVFSTNSIPFYLNYTQYRMPFNTDDAYVGVVARDVGIQAAQIPGFKLFAPRDNKTALFYGAILLGDGIDGPSMERFFSIFENQTKDEKE